MLTNRTRNPLTVVPTTWHQAGRFADCLWKGFHANQHHWSADYRPGRQSFCYNAATCGDTSAVAQVGPFEIGSKVGVGGYLLRRRCGSATRLDV